MTHNLQSGVVLRNEQVAQVSTSADVMLRS